MKKVVKIKYLIDIWSHIPSYKIKGKVKKINGNGELILETTGGSQFCIDFDIATARGCYNGFGSLCIEENDNITAIVDPHIPSYIATEIYKDGHNESKKIRKKKAV